jgi:hypothetical protein
MHERRVMTGPHMREPRSLEDLSGAAPATGAITELPVMRRRGPRIALLSLAAAILLLGAAIAVVFGYQAIVHGALAAAPRHEQRAS